MVPGDPEGCSFPKYPVPEINSPTRAAQPALSPKTEPRARLLGDTNLDAPGTNLYSSVLRAPQCSVTFLHHSLPSPSPVTGIPPFPVLCRHIEQPSIPIASETLRTRGSSCARGGPGRRKRCSLLNRLAAAAAVTGASLLTVTMEDTEGGSIGGAVVEKADPDTQNELPLLTDEKFDFDLSLSSSSANEDDEVFFGPVGHRERCVAASLKLQGLVPMEDEQPLTLSPLAGEKFIEIFKEARLLALQIESSGKKTVPKAREPEPALAPAPVPSPGSEEEFVQEARQKLDIFERGLDMQTSSPALKRETYCVLTPGVVPVPAASARLRNQGVAERKVMSRLQPPKSLSMPGKGALAKPQAGKQGQPLRLPARDSSVSLGLQPSEQTNGTAEASASSTSGGGSATKGPPDLPAPSKSGVRKTLLKPPGPTRTLLGGRSTSFSGSVCGAKATSNSSLLGTPARGKAKPSEPFSRLADTPRPKPSSQLSHGSIPCPKQTRAAPASMPLAGPAKESASVSLRQPQTPRTGIQRPSSNPSLPRSSQPSKPRGSVGPNSGAKVGPPPANPLRHPTFSIGASPDMMTPRLPSGPSFASSALHGTPARCSSGGALYPLGSSTRTPLNVRRLSTLPTPSGRRASALPLWPTPRTGPRASSPPQLATTRPPSQVPPKKTQGRPQRAQETSRPETSPPSEPPLVVPLALDFASPEQMPPRTPGEEKAKEQPVEKPAPPEAVLVHIGSETCATVPAMPRPPLRSQPLLDFSNSPEVDRRQLPLTPALASEGQLLIDLFHSPEVSKSIPAKPPPVSVQLIDLSSPLISLSPLEDKENLSSPLLKF
ncbi:G2 and S phase-expressed protein 1 [Dromiciops gliroides]|uniref:G2 and S phase-expressed protein 1 n=1 Tax=Dromiciops gliroides TaxID=33562 RepID=UPI001CC5FDD9|nr:G2 and S phase-expressed protein 1 [Dromiciops gliroides]